MNQKMELEKMSDTTNGYIEEMDFLNISQSLRRQWKLALAVMIAIFAGIALTTIMQTPQYKSEMEILIDKGEGVPVVDLEVPKNDRDQDRDLSTEMEILLSRSLIVKAIDSLKKSYPELSTPEETARVIQNISIRQEGKASVLLVSYQDTIPERTKAVLEALGDTYINYALKEQNSQKSEAIQLIEKKLPQAQQVLDETALAIRRFRQQYGIVDPDTYAVEIAQLQQSLAQQKQELEAAYSTTKGQYQQLRQQIISTGQNPETAIVESILSQDTRFQDLSKQLREIAANYALARSQFHDTHPSIESLRLRREELESLLRQRTRTLLGDAAATVNVDQMLAYENNNQTIASQLVSQLQQLDAQLAGQQRELEVIRETEDKVAAQFKQIPQLQQTYGEMQRNFEVRSNAVNQFLKKLQEFKIAEAQEFQSWKILQDPYLPKFPTSPNVGGNLLLGLVAGGILGTGVALVRDKLDPRAKGIKELRQLTGLPLLGTIPKVKQPMIVVDRGIDNQTLWKTEDSAFRESLCSLAITLRDRVPATGHLKSLVVTSTSPDEGKSTIVYNLGLLLSALGHRTLVVDADLRKPTIHHLAKLPNIAGLSTMLSEDINWHDLVYSSDVQNLDLITSGPIQAYPMTLLDSPRMKQLLDQWSKAYDYVLLDAPAIDAVADVQSLGKNDYSVLFVSAIQGARRDRISRALEILRSSGCHIAGLIVNLTDADFDFYGTRYDATDKVHPILLPKNEQIVRR